MFDKILIANRGEIACRIMRTAHRLGVRSVAVFSDADANALHVRLADEAARIGPASARESYLRIDAILEAAVRSRAQGIHPGYGFLSENAEFAQRCVQAGLVFIGPPSAAIRAMGSKSAAKALLQQTGVPLLPGYHGEDQSAALLQQQADQIGYPVLIKASAGGGGKGMRRVDGPADFAAALASCQREADASFGDGRVLVEKYLLRPRHIEIQVFTDTQGHGVYLFERDCSVQRRHQKVIEEAPAPGMTALRRARMGEAALAAAKAVGYVGAGTVEFIVAPNGDFYFMEMNTRLQVEHPVTEMITGEDLVEWQLRIACGEPLPRRQEELEIRGHAIEARIYAEDPDRGFLPCTGRLRHLRLPAASAAVRIDAGVASGDVVSPYYDPMIAKLIVWGETRELARARMRQALREFQIVGVANNVQFLSRLIMTSAFASADLDTALIEREQTQLFPMPSSAADLPRTATADPNAAEPHAATLQATAALAAAAVGVLRRQREHNERGPGLSVWRCGRGWRLNAPGAQRLHLRSHGTQSIVAARDLADGYELRVGQQIVLASVPPAADAPLRLTVAGRMLKADVIIEGPRCDVFIDGEHALVECIDQLAHVGAQAGADSGIRAVMPGRVVALLVQPGARVAKGQALLILEAMKMEHTTYAPADGICEAFNVALGEQVSEGTELVKFQSDSVQAAP
jgi:3-methylcrotonyl-CoA carboxylase alpha subunit